MKASPWSDRLRSRYPTPRVVDDREDRAPGRQVAEDLRLAEELSPGGSDLGALPSPVYRVWRNRRCLVATRREARLPRFEQAAASARTRGWPVVTRDSGGTLVPHLEGTLHLTLLLPRFRGAEPSTDEVYRLLGEPVLAALRRVGVSAGCGDVADSFCDGRFNLVAEGRKIAGTAQRWRGGLPGHPVRAGFVLAHLSLFVEGDMAAATREVNRFVREAGGEQTFSPDATLSVASVAALAGERAGRRGAPGPALSQVRSALLAVLTEGAS